MTADQIEKFRNRLMEDFSWEEVLLIEAALSNRCYNSCVTCGETHAYQVVLLKYQDIMKELYGQK